MVMSRRGLLVSAPGWLAAAGSRIDAASLPRDRLPVADGARAGSPDPFFPTQPPDLVREMVAVAHGNFARVKELVERQPTLARAAFDWGFGDWEDALGGASHMGNREIAEYLIAKGARPSIFSAAMLGELDVVRAFVTLSPGVQRIDGPHGITLLAHARAGGERARSVLSYLESLGDADSSPPTRPLPEQELARHVGTYSFGPDPTARIDIKIDKGLLTFTRRNATPRMLFHVGDRQFFPSGASRVRIRFVQEGDRIVALSIHDPDLVLTAKRLE